MITGLVGIDQGSILKQPADTEPGPPPGARYGVPPCSAYYAQKTADAQPAAYGKHQPYTPCGYVPQQLQSSYGESGLLKAGVTGRGVTVAITDAYAAPTIYQDAQKYNQVHDQPLFTPASSPRSPPALTASTRPTWDQYRIGGTSLSSPLLAGVVAVADQSQGRSLGFINPLYYQMLGTRGLHDIVAPTSPLAQVRTGYVNFLDNTQGTFFRLQTVDVQGSTLHDTPGYDDETGVGTPSGPAFFTSGR